MKIQSQQGKIIVEVDLERKNSYQLTDDIKIVLERNYDNFNRREVSPVNAVLVSGGGLPEGTDVVIHHNCTHDTNRIFDYKPLGGSETSSSKKYYAISQEDCYIWYDVNSKQWRPCEGFCTALRVYKPYFGVLDGIPNELVKQKLYIVDGADDVKGKVCGVVKAADYEMVFQGMDGREKRVIRLRYFENSINLREEIMFIDGEATELVQSGNLYVGLTKDDCKPLK